MLVQRLLEREAAAITTALPSSRRHAATGSDLITSTASMRVAGAGARGNCHRRPRAPRSLPAPASIIMCGARSGRAAGLALVSAGRRGAAAGGVAPGAGRGRRLDRCRAGAGRPGAAAGLAAGAAPGVAPASAGAEERAPGARSAAVQRARPARTKSASWRAGWTPHSPSCTRRFSANRRLRATSAMIAHAADRDAQYLGAGRRRPLQPQEQAQLQQGVDELGTTVELLFALARAEQIAVETVECAAVSRQCLLRLLEQSLGRQPAGAGLARSACGAGQPPADQCCC